MSIHTVTRNILLSLALLFMTPVYAQAPAQPEAPLPTINFIVTDGSLTKDTPRAKEVATKIISFLKTQKGVNVAEADDIDIDAPQTVDIVIVSVPETGNPDAEVITVVLGVHEPNEEYFIYLTSLGGELDKTVATDDVAGDILDSIVKNYGRYLSHTHNAPTAAPNQQDKEVITPDTTSHA